MRFSLHESPHLLLLQGYSQQHVSPGPARAAASLCRLPMTGQGDGAGGGRAGPGLS